MRRVRNSRFQLPDSPWPPISYLGDLVLIRSLPVSRLFPAPQLRSQFHALTFDTWAPTDDCPCLPYTRLIQSQKPPALALPSHLFRRLKIIRMRRAIRVAGLATFLCLSPYSA